MVKWTTTQLLTLINPEALLLLGPWKKKIYCVTRRTTTSSSQIYFYTFHHHRRRGNDLLPERELRRIVDARLRVDPRGDTPRLR